MKKEIGKAVQLYESFREKTPRKIGRIKMPIPKAVACIGYIEALDYRTTHGKTATLYRHDFAPGSRPLFAVSADGRQLLMLGGRFKFTERGIVDHDKAGREIEAPHHGKNINPRKGGKRAQKEWMQDAAIIRRHYGFPYTPTREEVSMLLADLYRISAAGTLDESQRRLYERLGLGRRAEIAKDHAEAVRGAARRVSLRRGNPLDDNGLEIDMGYAKKGLAKWCRDNRVSPGMRKKMWALFEDDPAYWSNVGFPGLERGVEASL
jgi:hypothetical protein